MRPEEAWSYAYAGKKWQVEFMSRAEMLDAPQLRMYIYKWWNPFFNFNVVRDVLKTYGDAVCFVQEQGLSTVLDLGSAFGMGTWLLHGDGVSATGYEIDPYKVRYARGVFPEVEFQLVDAGNLPERKFDAVVCSYSLNPEVAEQRAVLDRLSDTIIFIGDNCAVGRKIGKHTWVVAKGFQSGRDYGRMVRYGLMRTRSWLRSRRLRAQEYQGKKILSCNECRRIFREDSIAVRTDKGYEVTCNHCGNVMIVREKRYNRSLFGKPSAS